MNGVHDMGGMDGFGKVEPEPNEPVFHAAWEGRCLALHRALSYAGAFSIDQSRAAIEGLAPDVYLASSYYKRWELHFESLARQLNLADADELAAGHALRPGKVLPRKLAAGNFADGLRRPSYERPPRAPARFAVGERVRAKNIHPTTHTRLPRYVRGHRGVIAAVRGCQVFPDSNAVGAGENPQWLYTVVFDGRELWGDDADPSLKVAIDAFEPYLERVS